MDTEETWKKHYAFRTKGYGTNNLYNGLQSMSIDEALKHTYIKANPNKYTSALVVDVDREDAERFVLSAAWDDEKIPEPNWVTTNLISTHAHVGYFLETPVATSEASRLHPMRFAANVQQRLREALDGDIGYHNNITRSPFSLGHTTRFVRNDPYDLKTLHESLPPIETSKFSRKSFVGLGRNVEIFENIRQVAYKDFKNFKLYEDFYNHVLNMTCVHNEIMFATPLPFSEVHGIARSISKWVWRKFDAEALSKKQAHRVGLRWDKKSVQLAATGDMLSPRELSELIFIMVEEGASLSEVSEFTGLTKNQIKDRLKYLRAKRRA